MIDTLFEDGLDVPYPVPPGADQLTVCGSAEAHVLSSAANGPRAYPSAEALLDALIAEERLSGEEDPLEGVYTSLRHIS